MPLFKSAKEAAKKLDIGVKKTDADIQDQVNKILQELDLTGWGAFVDVSDEVLAGVTKDGVYQALLQVGLNGEALTASMSSGAVDYAKNRAAELVTQISESTRDMLRSDITNAIEEGWSTNKLADVIDKNYAFSFTADFEVEGYLRYRGDNFVKRFDANSYLYITKAMDYFDLSETGLTLQGKHADIRFLIIAFKSDWLYPSYQVQDIVRQLKIKGQDATYCEIKSTYGHDAFLLEVKEETHLVSHFLKKIFYMDN